MVGRWSEGIPLLGEGKAFRGEGDDLWLLLVGWYFCMLRVSVWSVCEKSFCIFFHLEYTLFGYFI